MTYRVALYATVKANSEEEAWEVARNIPFDQFDGDLEAQGEDDATAINA